MRKKILYLLCLIASIHLNAQTGIGTTSPHVSAKLEVAATNKGFLPPRVALTGTNDLLTIATPATGLVVFNTATAGTTPNNVLPGYYYYDGTKWNQLVDQGSLNSFSGFVPNYAQSNASSVTKSAVGDIVISQSITSSGRPIQIIVTGDANPQSSGAWVQLQLFRDGTAIGKKIQAESSSSNENVPYCLNFIDNPTAGTYTYTARITAIGGGSFQFGEADGNQITLLELGAWSAGTMPVSKGGTGVTTSTGTGNTVLSNSPTLETPTISSGNTAFPSSINVTPTTHATSKRAALWLDGWGIMQDILGNGSKNFSISQTFGGTYPPRLFINTDGNVGIGTQSPVSKLDVTGDVNVTGALNVSGSSNVNFQTPALLVGSGSGDEGGEIQLAGAQTNQSLSGRVIVDVYRNQLRILESGGNNRGVNIDLGKAPSGASGELMWKASGFVNAGTFVSLDNIRATVTSSGNRGLSLAAVSTTFSANIAANYGLNGGSGGYATNNFSVTTTASTSIFSYHFPGEGDGSFYTIVDKTNNRAYRITLMIGAGYFNNFISIERLF